MKFLAALVTVLMIVSARALTDEQKEKLKEHYSICMTETGVSKELVMKAKAGDHSVVTDELKKFTLCAFKRIGIFGEDGSIHREVAMAKVEEEKKEVVGKAVDACSSLTETDLADKAWSFYKCYLKERPGIAVL